MTRSSSSTRPNGRLVRSLRALYLLAVAPTALSCADDGTRPDDLRFGRIGQVRIEVIAPLDRGLGELQQIVSWSSEGPWVSTEPISYNGRPGDETVVRSRQDAGTLAGYYASWIALVNDETPVKLFLGVDLHPDLNPTCGENQSRVTVEILDAERADATSWTRCADGSLGNLSGDAAGPDPTAGRVVQAAQLARDFTVRSDFVSAYNGSVPFATLDRGEVSKAPMALPRVIEDANPLGGIELFAAAAAEADDPTERRRLIRRIRGEIAALNDVISDFLTFARPLRVKPDVIDLRAPLREAVDLVEGEVASGGGTLEVELPDEPLLCRGDPDHVKRAALNILRNAAQAGRRVRLEAEWKNGEVVVFVLDDGPGVTPEISGRIFDPFVTDKEQGAGLGLAIVKKVLEGMGGRVEVASADRPGFGNGARFGLYFQGFEDIPAHAREPMPSPEPVEVR